MLLETTCQDVFRLVHNREYDDAVAELTGLTDPISSAFVIASVIEGLKPAMSRKVVEALKSRLDLAEALDRRAAQGRA